MDAVKKDEVIEGPNVVGADEVETIVLDYVPQEFPIRVTPEADDFFKNEFGVPTDFKISDLVSQQVGINKLAKEKVEEKIDAEILVRVKDVEERAYKEAYDLGFQEGTQKAFEDKKVEVDAYLMLLKQVLSGIQEMSKELIMKKEVQILKVIHNMAEKIAMFEIENKPGKLFDTIEHLFQEIQSEERVIIKLNKEDADRLTALQEHSNVSFDFLENCKIEADNSVMPGGCKLASNYGQIDATVEQRVEKVWKIINENLPTEKGIIDELKTEEAKEENSDNPDDTDGDKE